MYIIVSIPSFFLLLIICDCSLTFIHLDQPETYCVFQIASPSIDEKFGEKQFQLKIHQIILK